MAAIYPKAVLPTPGGPKISVTLPRITPPETRWPGSPCGARASSSWGRPVETAREPWRPWSVWRACEADTVGSRSGHGQSCAITTSYVDYACVDPVRTRRCGRGRGEHVVGRGCRRPLGGMREPPQADPVISRMRRDRDENRSDHASITAMARRVDLFGGMYQLVMYRPTTQNEQNSQARNKP